MRKISMITGGIDTGKKHLWLGFWPRGERFKFANEPEGFAKIAAILKAAGVRRAGIESTSIYHMAVTDHLRAEGFEVLVMQPGQVKAFAKMLGCGSSRTFPTASWRRARRRRRSGFTPAMRPKSPVLPSI